MKFESLNEILNKLPRTKIEENVLAFILKKNDYYRDKETLFLENFDFRKQSCSLFIDDRCQKLFNIIKDKIEGNKTQNNPANFESVKITDDKEFNLFVRQLENKVDDNPSIEDFNDYIEELCLFRIKRKTIENCVDLIRTLFDKKTERTDKQEGYISSHLNFISELITSKKGDFPLLYAKDIEDIIRDLKTGSGIQLKLSTGIESLDQQLNYLRPGELVVIAGRPGMGKTSLALNVLYNLVTTSVKSLFFSLEMNRVEITQKLLNLFLKYNIDKNFDDNMTLSMSKEDEEKVSDYLLKIEHSFCFVDKPFLSLEETKRYVKEYNLNEKMKAKKSGFEDADQHGVKVIFIDYLQILNSSSSNPMRTENEKIAKITQTLKGLALELDCAIVLLSQLNRDNVKQADKRPNMSNLKGSGAIEQDANKIILLHREEYYVKNVKQLKGIVEVIVDKNRGGETGTVYLDWHGDTQEIKEIDNNRFQNKDDQNNSDEIVIDRKEEYLKYLENGAEQQTNTPSTPPKKWQSGPPKAKSSETTSFQQNF